jgi:hypothetical protein
MLGGRWRLMPRGAVAGTASPSGAAPRPPHLGAWWLGAFEAFNLEPHLGPWAARVASVVEVYGESSG